MRFTSTIFTPTKSGTSYQALSGNIPGTLWGPVQVNKPKPSVIHLTNLASGNQSQESLEMHHLHSTSTNIGS